MRSQTLLGAADADEDAERRTVRGPDCGTRSDPSRPFTFGVGFRVKSCTCMTVGGFVNSRCIGNKLVAADSSRLTRCSRVRGVDTLEKLRRELTANNHRAGSHSVHRWSCWDGPDCVSGNIGFVLREQPQASGGPPPIARRGRVLGREMSLRTRATRLMQGYRDGMTLLSLSRYA